jgi:NTE family protein
MELEFNKLNNIDLSLFYKSYGFDEGKKIDIVIDNLFIQKNIDPNITFNELYKLTNKILYTTTVCLNDKKICYNSYLNEPDMSVKLAVKMSMSIPLYFTPIKYKNKFYIDGGVIDNFPIKIFENKLEQVIGFNLEDQQIETPDINNIEVFLLNIIECFFKRHQTPSLNNYEKYSIKIYTEQISMINFNINKEIKYRLYHQGYNIANNILK